MSAQGRYAVYFAPRRHSAWWSFGAHWLGRDDVTGAPLAQPCPPGFEPQDFAALTQEPRRYGFHATLKAPMRLAGPAAGLVDRLGALAATLAPRPLALVPVFMDGFVALVPSRQDPGLAALAARCVTELDDLRAPLSDAERTRRQPERLDARGRELLDAYGYPLVLERFRFHMTVSGRCDLATAGRLVAHLAPQVRGLERDEPLLLDRLCLFHQAGADTAFVRVHEVELAG